jgi:L-xylulokinase
MAAGRSDTPVFLGIDVGGTVVKAAAFDGDGREIACCGSQLPTVHRLPGRNERLPEDMWNAVVVAVRGVISILPEGAASIRSIGCAGHGNGIYLLGADHRALGHGIVSSDTRGQALLKSFEAHPDASRITARRGQRFGASEPTLLMSWLDRHEPDRVARTAVVLFCKDYIRFRLSGTIGTDLCDASGAALIDVETQLYAEENFHRLGLSAWLPKLPPIERSTTVVGSVTQVAARETGLRPGTPVVAGTMDLEAVALGSGLLDGNRMGMSAGTWNIALQVLDQPVRDPLPLMQSQSLDGTRFLLTEGSPTGAANLAWLVRDLFGVEVPDWLQIEGQVGNLAPQDAGIVHLPFINGSRGEAQGCFLGIAGEVGRPHMLRAVFESTTFMLRSHMAELVRVTGRAPEAIRLSGGVTRSRVWSQMLADVIGLPIEVSQGTELGALGCAILGAAAVGHYGSLGEAVLGMSRISHCLEPDTDRHGIYGEKYRVFKSAHDALLPHWQHVASTRERVASA